MSLSWDWTDRMGECIFDDGFTGTLYRGNAFMICLAETDVTYNLIWFFADEAHAKNCLGLNKEYTECWSKFGVKKLKLANNYKETAKMVNLLAKAKVPIEIELFNKRDE